MTYTPFRAVADLPPIGPFPEHLRLDVKAMVPPEVFASAEGEGLESLACDLAAFANTRGGVILVGAQEEPRGNLKAYLPISEADAARVTEIYGRKARALCSPPPIVDAKAIKFDDRGWVVAVNVDAYAAPPIGVRSIAGTNDRPRWWAFPARRGTDNVPLRPEELATIMDPTYRRMVLRLKRIAPFPGNRLPLLTCRFGANPPIDFCILEVNADDGVLLVTRTQDDVGAHNRVEIPIEAIRLLWRDTTVTVGKWNAALVGHVVTHSQGLGYVAQKF